MEKTTKLNIPVEPEQLKALKVYSAQRGLSMSELVRIAIERQYGDILREINEKHATPAHATIR